MASGPVDNKDGTYTVTYTVTAANTGSGAGTYDVIDILDPATGDGADPEETQTPPEPPPMEPIRVSVQADANVRPVGDNHFLRCTGLVDPQFSLML